MQIETRGSGPDLVMIHGWAMHGGIFAPLVECLAPHFRLHLVDLPGHGRSREDTGGIDPADCARRIAAATPPAIWLGWSLGGLIAIDAAIGHAGQVRALILIATNPHFVSATDWPCGVAREVFEGFAADLRSDYRRAVERFLALEVHGSEHAQSDLRALKRDVFERGDPALEVLHEGLSVLEHADYRAALSKLSMPSLWVAGRRDRLVPPAAMRWGAEHSPHGHYLEFSAGHAPFIGHAQAIADAIVAFAGEVVPA